MFKWSSEHAYLSRYIGSGALNTVIGFATIFLLMAFGLSPLIANIGGYMVGLMLGFVVSKKFVFRSNRRPLGESVRYLAAFIICFMLNLFVLSMALPHFGGIFAQLLATITYTASMYVIMRRFVFQVETTK